jgi:uncharacterized membrane protein
MKKLIATLALSLATVATQAQTIPQPTPAQELAAANAITAILVGWFVLPAAVISGKTKELCDVMGGKYTPTGPDICPGGDWVKVIPLLKDLYK